MKENYIHEAASDLLNDLPQDSFRWNPINADTANLSEDQQEGWPFGSAESGLLFNTFNYMLSKRHEVWSIERIFEEAQKNRLCDLEQFIDSHWQSPRSSDSRLPEIEYTLSVYNMVDLLEDAGAIDFIDDFVGDKSEISMTKQLFRFNNSNASLAGAYEYLADLAALYGVGEEDVEDFRKISDKYLERAEKAGDL